MHHLLDLLQFGYINLEIFIPFEFILDWHNVFRIPDFPLMSLFEILLELVELCPKDLPFILDIV